MSWAVAMTTSARPGLVARGDRVVNMALSLASQGRFSGPRPDGAGPAEPLAANQRSSRTVRNVGPPVVTPKRTFQVESSAPMVAPKWRRPPGRRPG